MRRRPRPSRCSPARRPPWKLSQPIDMPGWSGSTAPQRTKCVPCSTSCSSLLLVGHVVAVAEQDQAVGLHAVLVVGVPVVGQLLERDQQVVAVARAGASDRAEHRQEERVDVRLVRGRILEQQQRQRARALRAQAGGVVVDLVVELAHRFEHALRAFPGSPAGCRAARATRWPARPRRGGRCRRRWTGTSCCACGPGTAGTAECSPKAARPAKRADRAPAVRAPAGCRSVNARVPR